MKRDIGYILLLLLTTAAMLTSCGSGSDGFDDEPQNVADNASPQEIRFNANVWRMMDGSRASFYTTGTLSSGSFTAAAYTANSTTEYITPTTVNWVTDKWVFDDGKHYWPAEGTLDFFAYMPTTLPSYITNMSDVASRVTYAAQNPQFKCKNLPMTYNSASPTENQGSGLQEFVLAMATGQSKAGQGASGVTMNFSHPFTRIKMELSASQATAITINTITFKSLKNNGSCSFAYNESTSEWKSTWTPSGEHTDFKATLNQDFTVTGSVQTIGVPYIMIPQNWTGNIEVEATWIDWGISIKHTLKTKVDAVDWAPGTSYTYTFTITETDLIVSSSKYTEQW